MCVLIACRLKYEIDTPLLYDVFGNDKIKFFTVDSRVMCLEQQLDPVPGRRYRGEHGVGLTCWLMGLPMDTPRPRWEDVIQALQDPLVAFRHGDEDTPARHQHILAYITRLSLSSYKSCWLTKYVCPELVRRLDKLRWRVHNVVADFLDMYWDIPCVWPLTPEDRLLELHMDLQVSYNVCLLHDTVCRL